MKEQIQLLIAQHKLSKQEAVEELSNLNIRNNEHRFVELSTERYLRSLFISELEDILEQC